MTRRGEIALALLLALSAATPAAALQEEPAAQPRLEDRIVAVVNEDPILDSDLRRAIGLGLVDRAPDEEEEALRRRVLDLLIDEKLRFQELATYGFAEVPVAEVDDRVEALGRSLGGRAALDAKLEELGLDLQGLRQLLARQLMVVIYVEERLGARVFVDLDDIGAYYEQVLRPELRARGEEVPPLESVRERIREVLRQERLNEEIDRWTRELRREADVEEFLDEVPAEPPGEPGKL